MLLELPLMHVLHFIEVPMAVILRVIISNGAIIIC